MGERSLAQIGTEVRSRRAELKKRIRDGEVDVAQLLEGEVDDVVEETALNMPVGQLVDAAPGIGDAVLEAAGVWPSRRLCELTTGRRRELAAAIRKEIQP